MQHVNAIAAGRDTTELTALIELRTGPLDLGHRRVGFDEHHHSFGQGRRDVDTGTVHVHDARPDVIANPGIPGRRVFAARRIDTDRCDVARRQAG